MTPDWLHQLLWFVSGVFATGAFWYFLSQKNYHATLWCGFAAVVVTLFTVALLLRNDIIKREATTSERAAPPPTEPFFVRLHIGMTFGFPGVLVYRYKSKFGDALAPVGLALVLEVTNKRPTAAKVTEYFVDLQHNQKWIRLPNLQPLNPTQFFLAKDGSLKRASRLDFTENSFDIQARKNTLVPGGSIKGWTFLEWPYELRASIPAFGDLKLTIENSHGERQSVILKMPTAGEPGSSALGGGEWHIMPRENEADLSHLKILPHVDLLEGFRKGTFK